MFTNTAYKLPSYNSWFLDIKLFSVILNCFPPSKVVISLKRGWFTESERVKGQKEQGSRREMTIDVAFKSLKMVSERQEIGREFHR